LKRKVRNFFARQKTNGDLKGETEQPADRYHLFIREGAVIQTLVETPALETKAIEIFKNYKIEEKNLTEEDWKKAKEKQKKKKEEENGEGDPKKKRGERGKYLSEYRDRAYRDALCQTYFDLRYFGQVVSTEGPLKGSFYGQIRGPLQITFAESLDKILQLDFSITRCAVANEKEAEKKDDDNRTMGRKHAVPYGLYCCHIYFSPAFAAKTGSTYTDFDNFLFALARCLGDYNVDGSSARPGGMRVAGLVDFQHSSALGNAPAHKLFDLVKVEGKKDSDGKFGSGSEFSQGLHDYTGSAPDGDIYVQTNKQIWASRCLHNHQARTKRRKRTGSPDHGASFGLGVGTTRCKVRQTQSQISNRRSQILAPLPFLSLLPERSLLKVSELNVKYRRLAVETNSPPRFEPILGEYDGESSERVIRRRLRLSNSIPKWALLCQI
jgi:CRISPR-associated protein Csd2